MKIALELDVAESIFPEMSSQKMGTKKGREREREVGGFVRRRDTDEREEDTHFNFPPKCIRLQQRREENAQPSLT